MLGNDLIDLQKAITTSNWQRKGYLDKIFSLEEKTQILSSPDPATLVWLFWSMKEAAYKIVNRANHSRFYQPKLFNCLSEGNNETCEGEVNYNGQVFYTQSSITDKMIHTVALEKKQHFNTIEISYLPNTISYQSDFNAKSNIYILTKDEYGIPSLIHKKSGKKHIASISHHGRFLAIVSLTPTAKLCHFLLQKLSS